MHFLDTASVGSDSSQSTSDDLIPFVGDCDSKLLQARINLSSLALICERCQLSDRAGAAVAHASSRILIQATFLPNMMTSHY